MTIHVTIGEAEHRLAELVAAAVSGEEVVLDVAGAPSVRLVPIEDANVARSVAAARRQAVIDMWRETADGRRIDVRSLKMSDDDLADRERRKFVDPA